MVNIENVLTRVDAANSKVFVRCTRTVGTTHFVGRNIVVSQANTDFLLSRTGATTEKLEGTNVNVSLSKVLSLKRVALFVIEQNINGLAVEHTSRNGHRLDKAQD